MKMRLPLRLFVSYALVAAVGAGVAYLTVRLLGPHLFDARMDMMDGASSGMMQGNGLADVHAAFASALNTALIVGVMAGVVAAALVAAFVTRRLLRPLEAIRLATRQIAAGSYEASVPLPSEPELAELAGDVNSLALALAETETRRTRLLGEVAHEMRTPLTSLDGYVEGMIDGVFAPDPHTLASLSAETTQAAQARRRPFQPLPRRRTGPRAGPRRHGSSRPGPARNYPPGATVLRRTAHVVRSSRHGRARARRPGPSYPGDHQPARERAARHACRTYRHPRREP